MAKATIKAVAEQQDGRVIFVTQSGAYTGQKMVMKTVHADAAIADGWGIEVDEALAPNDSPHVVYEVAPQSYNDWITDAMTPDEPAPEPPPAPTISALDPSGAETGSTDVTMVVTGTGFTATSVIIFNGFDEPTTLISDTQVSTIVKPSLFTEAIPLPVQVRDVGGTSNSLDFTFTAPPAP